MNLITLGGKTNGCHFRLRFDCRILLVVALLLSDFCKSDLEEMAQTPSAVLRFQEITLMTTTATTKKQKLTFRNHQARNSCSARENID